VERLVCRRRLFCKSYSVSTIFHHEVVSLTMHGFRLSSRLIINFIGESTAVDFQPYLLHFSVFTL
jgi:hypothetical protein